MTSVNLSDTLVREARKYGAVDSRSVPKQIEHWSRIGRVMEQNPDLNYELIKDILISQQENSFTPYEFGTSGYKD